MTALEFDVIDVPKDMVPDDLSDVEFPCRVCGREAGPYGGRGRKPVLCAEHKASKGTSGGRSAAPKNTNSNLAAQAADALIQLHSMAGMGAMVVGFNGTAAAIAGANDAFREQAYNALLTDPALCRMILKGGTSSGKVALLIAYAMFAAAVAPTAVLEYKMKQAEKAERLAEDEAGESNR